jgi:hypothetical protein
MQFYRSPLHLTVHKLGKNEEKMGQNFFHSLKRITDFNVSIFTGLVFNRITWRSHIANSIQIGQEIAKERAEISLCVYTNSDSR